MPERNEDRPEQQLFELITASWKSQAVYTFAELGLADHLAERPRRVADLARLVDADESALARLLAFVVSLGLVTRSSGWFELTRVGSLLRSDSAGSMLGLTNIYGSEFARGWSRLIDSVRSGRPSFEAVNGKALYEYLDEHPDRLEVFARAMAGSVLFDDFVSSGKFGRGRTTVDVGGGMGHLLVSALKADSSTQGVLFERPSMAQLAARLLADDGILARCSIVAGDFFKNAIPIGDRYLLSRVLHDWADDECEAILRNIRSSMNDVGRLFIIERVVEPTDLDRPLTFAFDVHMLVITGGRERTLTDYAQLCNAAGLAICDVHSLPMEMSVIEVERQ